MSNSFFQFKQFSIDQDRCAMKVSTDACIQGAWTPILPHVRHVLDIGCGTGLLSLMLAQRSADIYIDAIEIDVAAAAQAVENIFRSPWKERIQVLQGDARTLPVEKKYDLIICNPPFFNNSLLGDDAARNRARHTLTLPQEDLFGIISNNLAADGYACILLPEAEKKLWEETVLRHGWYINDYLFVKDNGRARVKRVVSCCAPRRYEGIQEILIIKNDDGPYTDRFTDLLRPFYLKL